MPITKIYLEKNDGRNEPTFVRFNGFAEAADFVVKEEGIVNDNCNTQTDCRNSIMDSGEYTGKYTWRVQDAVELRRLANMFSEMYKDVTDGS